MPELPEVETIRRVLVQKLTGRRILAVRRRAPAGNASRLDRSLNAHRERWDGLVGRRVSGIRRRGKYLLLDLDRGGILFHLGMTGQLFAVNPSAPAAAGLPALPDPHTHLSFALSGGLVLHFRDIRKFGQVRYLADRASESAALERLGPEPFSRSFTAAYLLEHWRGKKGSVKARLLDQGTVAGLGNIYVDETLFRAGLAPQTPAGRLSRAQAERLVRSARAVLREAIRHRGTTLSDYYDPESRRGGFQERLRVYGRADQACSVCGGPVCRTVLAQRGTHWCPRCQPVAKK